MEGDRTKELLIFQQNALPSFKRECWYSPFALHCVSFTISHWQHLFELFVSLREMDAIANSMSLKMSLKMSLMLYLHQKELHLP